MTTRVILAVVEGKPGDRAVLAVSADLGRRAGALVRVLAVRPDPALAASLATPDAGIIVGELVVAAIEAGKEAVARARETFETWRRDQKIGPAAPDGFGAEWVGRDVPGWGVASEEGMLADLVVAGRGDTAGDLEVAETILLESGRALLLVPDRPVADLLARALVAWKPSVPATHALAAALPLLGQAGEVRIFAIEDEDALVPAGAEAVRAYLARHGVQAARAEIAEGARSVGDALLRTADATQASLVVLGAYSHSRLRELILGGVTTHVLEHATVPLLMAH